MDIDIRSHGALPGGEINNTASIQSSIDACHSSGGGRVIIAGGTYMTGRLYLRSNVELYLAADGILLGSPCVENYPDASPEEASHVYPALLPRWHSASLIFANEEENIAITGPGVIDGNGEHFIQARTDHGKGWPYKRIDALTPPRVVFFTGCKNIRVTDVTMRNQPAGWSYWIHDCDYVAFDRVKIMANVLYPNNDGIHINCSRNVTISNADITCGDDCIVMRANNASLKEPKVCEKLTVTNCNLTSYSACIRIGWINDGVIRNAAFSNLVMTDSSVGVSMIMPAVKRSADDLGTNNTAPSDVGIDETLIENLTFSNIIMSGILDSPIKIRPDDSPLVRVKAIRNLYFNGIHSSGPSFPLLAGTKKTPLENIHFTDCTFEITDRSEFSSPATHGAGAYEYDPDAPCAMNVRHAKNVVFQNTAFTVR